MSARAFGRSAGFRVNLRRFSFATRGIARGLIASLAAWPLIACGIVLAGFPDPFSNWIWLAGAGASVALLIVVVRALGRGRGIIWGFLLSLASVAFLNGVVCLVVTAVILALWACGLSANLDVVPAQLILGVPLTGGTGFILHRMDGGYRS